MYSKMVGFILNCCHV